VSRAGADAEVVNVKFKIPNLTFHIKVVLTPEVELSASLVVG